MILQNTRNVLLPQRLCNPLAFLLRQRNAPVAIIDA